MKEFIAGVYVPDYIYTLPEEAPMVMTGDIVPEHEVIAGRIIEYLDKHLRASQPLGNKMKMPVYMAEWYREYARQSGADKVDQFFQMHLGYGHSPLILRSTFRQDGFSIEFCSPDGTRLTALEWLLLCRTQNEGSTITAMVADIQDARSSQSISPKFGDESVVIPERVPWSKLAQDFAETWGRADPADPQPESVEVLGIQGSGKTYWVCKAVQERMIVRRTPCIILQSKPDDSTITSLGWPIYAHGEYQKALKDPWCVYWPQTNALGRARRVYQADAFRNLLDRLWRPQANTIVVWDDIGYIQSLFTSDGESLNSYIEMFLREGRSVGLTNVLVKQRPQGAKREMHSETKWTVAYKPKDEDDQERFAQIMGNKKRYLPIFEQMSLDRHEFLIKHFVTDTEYISWVDTPLRPLARPKKEEAQKQKL